VFHKTRQIESCIAWVRLSAILVALLLMVAGAAPVAADVALHKNDIDMLRVAKPGAVLVDSAKRASQLKTRGPQVVRRMCGGPPPILLGEPAPVSRSPVASGERDAVSSGERAIQTFSLTLMTGAAAALAGDAEAATIALDLLTRWAQANALAVPTDANERVLQAAVSSLRRTMLGAVASWAVLRERLAPPAETILLIEQWLHRRVLEADQSISSAGRHAEALGETRHMGGLARSAMVMAFGALTGDHQMFRRGPRSVVALLQDMRADGSLPTEMSKGMRALAHQRSTVAGLVTILEIARVQGIDLETLEVDGKRVKRVTDFLMQALVEPATVAPYAPERQDTSFLDARPSGRHAMAWFEPWYRRSGIHPMATGEVPAALIAQRPLVDELAGGNTTCMFARF
jgi:hypothetical protein